MIQSVKENSMYLYKMTVMKNGGFKKQETGLQVANESTQLLQ